MSYKSKAYCLKFTLVLTFVLFCLIGKSQYNFSGIDKLLANNQKALGKNVAALLYKDGKIIYQKEMGEDFKIKSKAPVADCSKWLTAALVMTFVDEGKISLDEKVSTYLPIFETYGKSYITLRQCLSHQTGIEDNEKTIVKLMELQRRKFESLEDQVNFLAKKFVVAKPGTTFNYGNMGLNIAGRVLEVVSKKKFELLMKQRIFTPLNMKNSTITPEDNATNPSGGAISTASDYMNFLAMILDKGLFMGNRILSEAAIKEMQTIQTQNITKKYTPKVAEGYEYGLGEWIESVDNTGNSTVISAPGLNGTFPWIDKCRKYACILLVGDNTREDNKEIYIELKKAVNNLIPANCN